MTGFGKIEKSGTSKLTIALVVIGVLFGLAAWKAYEFYSANIQPLVAQVKSGDVFTTDPKKMNAQLAVIGSMKMPPKYAPAFSSHLDVMGVTVTSVFVSGEAIRKQVAAAPGGGQENINLVKGTTVLLIRAHAAKAPKNAAAKPNVVAPMINYPGIPKGAVVVSTNPGTVTVGGKALASLECVIKAGAKVFTQVVVSPAPEVQIVATGREKAFDRKAVEALLKTFKPTASLPVAH